jgi:hypothetical protein
MSSHISYVSGLDLARLLSRAFYQDAVLPSVTKCPSVTRSSGNSLGKQTSRPIGKEPCWN